MKFPSGEYQHFNRQTHLRWAVANSAVTVQLKDGTEADIWVNKVQRVGLKGSPLALTYIEGWNLRMHTDGGEPEHLHGPTRVSVKVMPDGGGYIRLGWGEREVQISCYLQG